MKMCIFDVCEFITFLGSFFSPTAEKLQWHLQLQELLEVAGQNRRRALFLCYYFGESIPE